MNVGITIAALYVAVGQIVFFINLVWSLRHGKKADGNPWGATSLEWQTPVTPPAHGNWGPRLPVVYRWAYDYSVPGASRDFIPQTVPGKEGREAEGESQP
jgi:cytochrome c oxidase subunit 1